MRADVSLVEDEEPPPPRRIVADHVLRALGNTCPVCANVYSPEGLLHHLPEHGLWSYLLAITELQTELASANDRLRTLTR